MDDQTADKPAKGFVIGQDLALMSVAELERTIALLREEIGRLEADMTQKAASRDAADAFFKR